MLQRAIAHYRFPLFKLLAEEGSVAWTFYCSTHNLSISTGLPSNRLGELNVRPTHNRKLFGPFLFQTGVRLSRREFDAFALDLGWTILSTPLLLLKCRWSGIGTVGWSKGIPQNPNRRESLLKRLYQKSILSLCDALVVYGRISRDYFKALGYPESRIFIAQNTIDTRRIASEVSQAREAAKVLRMKLVLSNRFVFGYLGALVPRKKVQSIVRAFEQVRATGRDAVLIIAGGGSEIEPLKQQAAASPFSADILLPGRIPDGEEGAWFQTFDAYLSYAEGGLGILEAMANGRLVVSTPERYPETEFLMDGETAMLSRDFSEPNFAERMCEAWDSRKRDEMGRRAQELVLQEATLEGMAGAIHAAVRSAVARRNGSSTIAL